MFTVASNKTSFGELIFFIMRFFFFPFWWFLVWSVDHIHEDLVGVSLLKIMIALNSYHYYNKLHKLMDSVQFTSVTLSCPTLCDPMDYSAPGFPVLHHLLELAQTHVHRVSDAIQPSHPLFPPFPPAFDLSQHQGLFQWVGSLIR